MSKRTKTAPAADLATTLRQAIRADDRRVHAIAGDAEMDPIGVWRFLRGGGLSLESADKLCAALGLELRKVGR